MHSNAVPLCLARGRSACSYRHGHDAACQSSCLATGRTDCVLAQLVWLIDCGWCAAAWQRRMILRGGQKRLLTSIQEDRHPVHTQFFGAHCMCNVLRVSVLAYARVEHSVLYRCLASCLHRHAAAQRASRQAKPVGCSHRSSIRSIPWHSYHR